ncbi:MAG: hypothetical protein IJ348_04325 [Alistipes sp.]|nr:hypothetical protein [Alistipes sp.]
MKKQNLYIAPQVNALGVRFEGGFALSGIVGGSGAFSDYAEENLEWQK